VYWAGTSFAAATTIFTDPNLQTIAPDGWYSVGLISREMVAGILGAPVTCPECDISCDTIVSGAGGIGEYRSDVLLGNDTGAVIIRFNNYSIPDKCTWTYDGVSASEYSTALFGYMQGMIGEGALIGTIPCGGVIANCTYSCGGTTITNASGSGGATINNAVVYNGATAGGVTSWVNSGSTTTLGPYANKAAGGTTLVDGQPGEAMMVVPKPNGLPDTMSFVVDGPCAGTAWRIAINCPIELNLFKCKAGKTFPCTDVLPDDFCTAHVGNATGVSGGVFVNDWAFEDVNGVTPKPADTYLVEDNAGVRSCVVVSANGVITAVSVCSGSC